MSGAADKLGPDPKSQSRFMECLSCRVLSGGACMIAGAYVFNEARKVMRRGAPTTLGTVAQITFALSIATWGMVVIANPVGKVIKKTED